MQYKLKKSFTEVREIGFLPKSYNFIGLESVWSIDEKLRKTDKYRLGVITSVGTDITNLKIGDVVCFNSFYTKDALFSDVRLIDATNLMGKYEGVILKDRGYMIDNNQFSFTPLDDRLVVSEVKETEKNGLIIPEGYSDKPYKIVEVVVVGANVKDISTKQRLLVGRMAGMPIVLKEGEFLLMRETEVYGILN